MTGSEVQGAGNGLDALPIPISTPGYDTGPYFTAATWITKDIDSSVQNMGVYRGNLKAADRLAVMMQISTQSKVKSNIFFEFLSTFDGKK